MEKKADEIIFTPGFIVKNDKEYYLTEYGMNMKYGNVSHNLTYQINIVEG